MKEMYSSPKCNISEFEPEGMIALSDPSKLVFDITVNGYGLDIYDMKCAMAIRPVHD